MISSPSRLNDNSAWRTRLAAKLQRSEHITNVKGWARAGPPGPALETLDPGDSVPIRLHAAGCIIQGGQEPKTETLVKLCAGNGRTVEARFSSQFCDYVPSCSRYVFCS